MRDIKFRGLNKDNKWIYGYYFKYDDTYNIVPGCYSSKPSEYFQVDPDTIGQFTGLLDKNGVEIYEEDRIIVYFENEFDNECVMHEEGSIIGMTVLFDDGCWCLKHEDSWMLMCQLRDCDALCEIVGNIHDNK